MKSDPHSLVCMGQFGSTYAVQGWLKLQSFTDPDEAIFSYQPWFVGEGLIGEGFAGESRARPSREPVQIEASRRHGRGFVVKLRGIENPEAARALIGKKVYVSRAQLPALPDGEYYWADLIGLNVINRAGRHLGQVKELMETGANDVLVIQPTQAGKANILIPYVMQHYIDRIDLDAQTMLVDWDWDDESE